MKKVSERLTTVKKIFDATFEYSNQDRLEALEEQIATSLEQGYYVKCFRIQSSTETIFKDMRDVEAGRTNNSNNLEGRRMEKIIDRLAELAKSEPSFRPLVSTIQ